MNFYNPNKKKNPVPEWVYQYGAYLGIVLILALFYIGTKLISLMSGPKPPVPIAHAQLSVVLGPVRTWQDESDTRIKSVEVKVQNSGTIGAQGVAVNAVVRETAFPLAGKSVLAVGEIASYSAVAPISVTASDAIDIQLTCATCAAYAPAP